MLLFVQSFLVILLVSFPSDFCFIYISSLNHLYRFFILPFGFQFPLLISCKEYHRFADFVLVTIRLDSLSIHCLFDLAHFFSRKRALCIKLVKT